MRCVFVSLAALLLTPPTVAEYSFVPNEDLLQFPLGSQLSNQTVSDDPSLSELDQAGNQRGCYCFPGDSCWPGKEEWDIFNSTVGGRLIATVPIGAPCHDSSFGAYDAERCSKVQAEWPIPEVHVNSTSSIMAFEFANRSCDPFMPREAGCAIGAYIQYAVKAHTIEDYQATLHFVQKWNIRLVIRNTGHDYYGKSTGAGSVALWTQHLKKIEVLDYESKHYRGKALKVGAGVSISEAQEMAHSVGLMVTGGNGRTVGFAGGYTQGGGHGPFASKYGLASDQALEWEVMIPNGDLVVASPDQNKDLYWALSGGGGCTFGAVWSLTTRAFEDLPVAGANLTFMNDGSHPDRFYESARVFLNHLPALTRAGAFAFWLLTEQMFLLIPTLAPGQKKEQLQELLEPTISSLRENDIKYNLVIEDFPDYISARDNMLPSSNVTEFIIGGRLIPRALAESVTGSHKLINTLRSIISDGGVVSGVSFDVSQTTPIAPNSANPLWREALFSAVFGLNYDRVDDAANRKSQRLITDVMMPKLAGLTPGGGAYLNEGDVETVNWQEEFFGGNYARLKEAKAKWDPNGLFYANKGVGADDWIVRADGRLCKKTVRPPTSVERKQCHSLCVVRGAALSSIDASLLSVQSQLDVSSSASLQSDLSALPSQLVDEEISRLKYYNVELGSKASSQIYSLESKINKLQFGTSLLDGIGGTITGSASKAAESSFTQAVNELGAAESRLIVAAGTRTGTLTVNDLADVGAAPTKASGQGGSGSSGFSSSSSKATAASMGILASGGAAVAAAAGGVWAAAIML